jgi:hypothetical protein
MERLEGMKEQPVDFIDLSTTAFQIPDREDVALRLLEKNEAKARGVPLLIKRGRWEEALHFAVSSCDANLMLYAFREAKAVGKEKKMEKIFAENEQARDIWAKFTSGENRVAVLGMGGKSSRELLRHFDEWQGDGEERLKEALKKEDNVVVSDAYGLYKAMVPIKKWLRNKSLNIPEPVESDVGFFGGIVMEMKKLVHSKLDTNSETVPEEKKVEEKKVKHKHKKKEEEKPSVAAVEGSPPEQSESLEKPKKKHKESEGENGEKKPRKKRHHHHNSNAAHEEGGLLGSVQNEEEAATTTATRPIVSAEVKQSPKKGLEGDAEGDEKKKPMQDRYDLMTPLELFEQVILTGELGKIKMMVKILDLSHEEALWKRVLTGLKFDNMEVLKLVRKEMSANELIEFQGYCVKRGNGRACDYLKGLDPDADAAKKKAREAALKRK